MPDLLNVLEHKKNTKVCVNGNVYDIGPDGVVKNVADADASKLLQNERVWKSYDPKRASAIRAQAKAAAPKMQLLDVNGKPVVPEADKPGQPMDPNVEVYKRPPVDKPPPVPEGPPPVPESAETEEAVDETEGEEPEDVEEDGEDVGEDGEDEEAAGEAEDEWPDPKESMTVAYLTEMAEAYEVDVTDKPTKKVMVKRIREAMYE